MVSKDDQRFVAAFVQYLREKMEVESGPDPESLEVAIQCLESSFNISPTDQSLRSSVSLFSLFTGSGASSSRRQPSTDEKQRAEQMKNEGNDLMKDGKFNEAIQKYSEALRLHESPIFYCNRAAAYSKLEKNQESINDCQSALKLDASYSKAYGRMGLAYSCMNKYREARDAYKKALELEPSNEGFKNNLAIAEEKLREPPTGAGQQQFPGMGGANPFGGGFDMGNIGNILNNPALMNFASQVMSDPAMQNMMSSMMQGAVGGQGQGGQGGQAAGGGGGVGNINNLLQAGQQLASQMQQQNPELIEQLRRQFQGGRGPNDPQDPQNQPPDGGSDPSS